MIPIIQWEVLFIIQYAKILCGIRNSVWKLKRSDQCIPTKKPTYVCPVLQYIALSQQTHCLHFSCIQSRTVGNFKNSCVKALKAQWGVCVCVFVFFMPFSCLFFRCGSSPKTNLDDKGLSKSHDYFTPINSLNLFQSSLTSQISAYLIKCSTSMYTK